MTSTAKYFRDRDKLASTKISNVEEIAKLPWHGNHASDNGLFNAIEKFIKAQTDKEVQRRAYYLMGKFGMGIDQEVTDRELKELLVNL